MPCLGPDWNNHREPSWLYQKNERATGGTKEPPPAAPAGLTSPHENSPTLYGTPSTADATHPACESRGDSDSKSNSHRTYEEQHQRPFEWACGHVCNDSACICERAFGSLTQLGVYGREVLEYRTEMVDRVLYIGCAHRLANLPRHRSIAWSSVPAQLWLARCSSIAVS